MIDIEFLKNKTVKWSLGPPRIGLVVGGYLKNGTILYLLVAEATDNGIELQEVSIGNLITLPGMKLEPLLVCPNELYLTMDTKKA